MCALIFIFFDLIANMEMSRKRGIHIGVCEPMCPHNYEILCIDDFKIILIYMQIAAASIN
jgi:hypothetical protein